MEDSICGKGTFEKNPESHHPKPPSSNLDRAVTDPADRVIGDRSITDRSIVWVGDESYICILTRRERFCGA